MILDDDDEKIEFIIIHSFFDKVLPFISKQVKITTTYSQKKTRSEELKEKNVTTNALQTTSED
jgi:hypothetical protein